MVPQHCPYCAAEVTPSALGNRLVGKCPECGWPIDLRPEASASHPADDTPNWLNWQTSSKHASKSSTSNQADASKATMSSESNTIRLSCDKCGQALKVPTDKGNLTVRCPKCRHEWDWEPFEADQPTSPPQAMNVQDEVQSAKVIIAQNSNIMRPLKCGRCGNDVLVPRHIAAHDLECPKCQHQWRYENPYSAEHSCVTQAAVFVAAYVLLAMIIKPKGCEYFSLLLLVAVAYPIPGCMTVLLIEYILANVRRILDRFLHDEWLRTDEGKAWQTWDTREQAKRNAAAMQAKRREADEAERKRREAAEAERRRVETAARQDWQQYYERRPIGEISKMPGEDFERLVAKLLGRMGYHTIEFTPKSGDQGADILCTSPDGKRTAVQVKRWSGSVGNSAVQEVRSGIDYYRCTQGIVITNSRFTSQAHDLASVTGVVLYDGKWLESQMQKYLPGTVPPFDWEVYRREVEPHQQLLRMANPSRRRRWRR